MLLSFVLMPLGMLRASLCGRNSTNHGKVSLPRDATSFTHGSCSNRVPWIIIAVCDLVSAILILILHFYLARENKKRDAERPDETYDDVYIAHIDANGRSIEAKVDKVHFPLPCDSGWHADNSKTQAFLDLTDKQNREFRYVL